MSKLRADHFLMQPYRKRCGTKSTNSIAPATFSCMLCHNNKSICNHKLNNPERNTEYILLVHSHSQRVKNTAAWSVTLFLTLRVYPWFIAVVGYALPVELVELYVYTSVAVINTKKATKWTKSGGGYTVRMF